MSSSFKTRSDYFKGIAKLNRLIAHERPIDGVTGNVRKSFHRINNEEELNESCVNWAHFPCVVHIGNDWNFKQPDTGKPREITINHLHFLARATGKTAEAQEAAYDLAATAMKQFLSYMVEDVIANGRCGNLFLFDLNRSKAERLEPVNANLYGWYLTFLDEAVSPELVYNDINWFTD